MKKIIIEGPCKLKGSVKIQGAKNSAMKHVFIPLITNGVYTLDNIPQIGSTQKHLKLVELQGAKIKWANKNKVIIDTRNVKKAHTIPKSLFYYTSGATHIIPILASRFGTCKIKVDPIRKDSGGDQIGSRTLKQIILTLEKCGVSCKRSTSDVLEFKNESEENFVFDVPVNSFSASVLSLFCALFKKGKSKIRNCTSVCEFWDIVNFLTSAGAKIEVNSNDLMVTGPAKLHSIIYKNMSDVHDFVTFLSAALSTNSDIKFTGIDYSKMRLEYMEKTTDKMNIEVDYGNNSAHVLPQLTKIKSYKIFAGQAPKFVTEWQVLFSPLLTQIRGTTKVVETMYSNRMQHWNEMKKMGANYKFYKDAKYPEQNGMPRAVRITGPQKLKGAKVIANDVRSGAALVISGLIATGKTQVSGVEHIQRGYENLVERLQKLGATIKYS